MKNNFKNLVLYELKRMIFIFVISILLVVVFDIIYFFINYNFPIAIVEAFDDIKLISLYVFMILQIVYLSFRTFADRKLFDYMHISAEKVFLVRLILNFCATIFYTLFLLLVGTSGFAIVKALNKEVFVLFKNNLMFTFYGKSGLYIFFCINNGFFIVLFLSLLNLLQVVVFSTKTVIFKIIWIGIVAMLAYGIAALYKINIIFPNVFAFDYYKIGVPLGYYDYSLYEYFKLISNTNYYYREPTVFRFLFTVNILNVLSFISTVIIVYLSFVSNSYFTAKNKTSSTDVTPNDFLGENPYE